MHRVIENRVETTGDKGFGVAVVTLPNHEAAVAYARRIASLCGGEVVVEP